MLARVATRPLERLLQAAAAAAASGAAAAATPLPATTSPAAWSACQQRLDAHSASRFGSFAAEHAVQQGSSLPAGAAAHRSGSGSKGRSSPPNSRCFAASSYQQQQQEQPYDHSDDDDDSEARRRYASATDDPAFQQQRHQLLDAALRHVPALGWGGGAAAAAAAAELGLSPAAAGMLGSDSELVQAFVQRCNQRLEAELAALQRAGELEGMDARGILRTGLILRLRMVEPHLPNWAQALALLAQPQAAPRTVQLYAGLADALWHAAGDASTDLSWYTRRALLAGVYSASELFMLSDASPGLADTWDQLDRRLGEALHLAQTADEGALSRLLGLLKK